MSDTILFVDDDPNILAAYQRGLRKQFAIDTVLGGEQGLKQIGQNGPYAVVVADMQMPGMNGLEFLTRTQQLAPDTVRIMLTGNADQKTAVDAVNQGHVFRFLNKPCPPDCLALTLSAGLKQYRLVTAERELLESTLRGSVRMLTEILSVLDPKSFGLAQGVKGLIPAFVSTASGSTLWELEIAAMLAPIGLMTVPPVLMQKSRSGEPLSETEKQLLARVPEIGAELLSNIPRLESVAEMVRYQAKGYDGSGYPRDGVKGDEIPVGARILKLLMDMLHYEAGGMPRFRALKRLQENAPKYDPRLLDAACVAFDVYLDPSAPAGGDSRREVTVDELRPGAVLMSGVESTDGVLIVPAGTHVTPVLLQKICNFAALGQVREPLVVD